MEASNPNASLVKALAAFQAEVRDPVKDSTNPHFKSRYADLHAVLAAVRPVLAKHGLAVVQVVETTQGINPLLATILLHADGGSLTSRIPLTVNKPGPQEFGSVMSYLRRYSLMAMLGIAGADDDDDGESATPRGKTPVVQAKPQPEVVQFEMAEEATAAFAQARTMQELEAMAKRCLWFKGADKDTVAFAYRARKAELGGGK